MVDTSTDANACGIFSLSVKHIITVILEIFFDSTPEILNGIEFTMEFGQENAQVAMTLNHFLNSRFLTLKIWLS